MPTSTTTRADIRRYLAELCGLRIDAFADDDDLIAGGIVASMQLIDLVTWVEDRFAVPVGPDDIDRGHFTSVSAIAAFVEAVRR
jgi:acyl carrier protein